MRSPVGPALPHSPCTDFIKLVVTKLISLYLDMRGDEQEARITELLRWQFEECPELIEQHSVLALAEHYFDEFKKGDQFLRWLRGRMSSMSAPSRVPSRSETNLVPATWRQKATAAALLGDLDTLTPILVTAATQGQMDPAEYCRWRSLIMSKHVGEATEGGVSFGVLRSSTASNTAVQAVLGAMLARYPNDERLLSDEQDRQDFCVLP